MALTWSRALLVAAALLVASGASVSAQENPLRLTCETTRPDDDPPNYPFPVRFQVDVVNRIVELRSTTGGVMASTQDTKLNARAPTIRITDSVITWDLRNTIGFIFDGTIDRETGDANASWHDARNQPAFFRGRCRLAAAKF